MKSYKVRQNPIGITNSILLVALFGGLAYAGWQVYKNIDAIRSVVDKVKGVNKDLTELVPKLQGNIDKISKMTKGLVPKEAQGIANLFK